MRSFYQLHIVSPPAESSDIGEYASIALTDQFFYIHDGRKWRRTAFDQPSATNLPWAFPTRKLDYLATIDNEYFYVYFRGSWKTFAMSSIDHRVFNRNDAIYSPNLITKFPLQVIGARTAGEDAINASSYGREGSLAFDANYFYCFVGGNWKKRAISDFSNVIALSAPVLYIPPPTPPTPPPTPINLIVTSGSNIPFCGDTGSAILTWAITSGSQDYFAVEKSINGVSYSEITTSIPLTTTDTTVTSSISGSTYWYRVAAVNAYGTSSYSNTASLTITCIPTVIVLAVTSGSAVLNWTYNFNNQDYFTVERAINGVDYTEISTSIPLTYTDSTVTSSVVGTTYWYQVAAINSDHGTSSYSNTASITFTSSIPTSSVSGSWNAWWTMDSGTANNEIDSVNGIVLPTTLNPGFATTVAGKVNNALQFSCSAGVSCINTVIDANLISSGTGSTVVFWLNVNDAISDSNNYAFLSYRFDQNSVNYTILIDRSGVAPANWTAYLNSTPYITKASATGWHFFAVTFDIFTGDIGFDIDQSGMTTTFALIPPIGANTTGRVSVGGSGGGIFGSFLMQVDEFAVYNRVLTTTQLDYLYNLGVGKTWPVTLPP